MLSHGVMEVVLLLLLAPLVICSPAKDRTNPEGSMLKMLDTMQQLMTGGHAFDRKFYTELRACMTTFDSRLPYAQDSAWKGIIDYWNMGGGFDDSWGATPTNYSEHNVTASTLNGMTIYEPCDYASNVAYYHDVTEFCSRRVIGEPFAFADEYVNALGKAYSALAMGSSFMHGSNTLLGRQQDRWTLRVVAYLIHQSSVSTLSVKSPVICDLSEVPRKRSAVELVDYFLDMYISLPVHKWYAETDSVDVPHYMLSFAGIFSSVLSLSFEPEMVDMAIPLLADAFKMPDDMKEFIINRYIPEFREATVSAPIETLELSTLIEKSIGPVVKLVYAFLWQERVLTQNNLFLDPFVNFIGFELLPRINHIANEISTYEHFDSDFQNGTNIYPGDYWCNPVIPHAKWHLESAIGLLDLTYLADEMCRMLKRYSKQTE